MTTTREALKKIGEKLERLRIELWACERTPNRHSMRLAGILNELGVLAVANAAQCDRDAGLEAAAKWHDRKAKIAASGTGGAAKHLYYAQCIRAMKGAANAEPAVSPLLDLENSPFVCEECNKLVRADAMSNKSDGNRLTCINCAWPEQPPVSLINEGDMRHQIREKALACGFKLKPQADGTDDLNSYVYTFADEMRALARQQVFGAPAQPVAEIPDGLIYAAASQPVPADVQAAIDAALAQPVQAEPSVAVPAGFAIKYMDGQGWIVDPPEGSRWMVFEGTPAGDFMNALFATAPAQQVQPAAFVPVHPRTGPLWANTITSKDQDHPRYPLMEVYTRPPAPAQPVSCAVDEMGLPPLPDAVDTLSADDGYGVIGSQDVYTAHQMYDYALAALSAVNQVNAAQPEKDAERWREYLRQQYEQRARHATVRQCLDMPFDAYKAREDAGMDAAIAAQPAKQDKGDK